MDDERARALLTAERIRVEGLLAGTSRAGVESLKTKEIEVKPGLA